MSSMVANRLHSLRFLPLVALACASAPVAAQSYDNGRAQLVASQPGQAAAAVARWKQLTGSSRMAFSDYAGFALAYPDFPRMEVIRSSAEGALERDLAATPQQVAAFFDRFPPMANPARARYALALSTLGRPNAREVARAAWRGGEMSSGSEAYLQGLFGPAFTADDHEERMRALLWQGDSEAAARQMNVVQSANREGYMAQLALLQGNLPTMIGLSVPASVTTDPAYVFNLARHYRNTGQTDRGRQLLATRATFARPPHDAQNMITEMLAQAKGASANTAAAIAGKVDDLFAPGTDISALSYKLRDDYTSLMWLGGTSALWSMGDGNRAAPMFYRYGNAARTPQTRSKGFYWAGLASTRAGNQAEANRFFEMAARYPEYFYGQLALERLGRPLPRFNQAALAQPLPADVAAFNARPLVQAIRFNARSQPDWRTERYFFTELADQATTPGQMQMAANLARELGLNELAVVLGRVAPEKDLTGFTATGFPVITTPAGSDYTMVHAITRQESEFDRDRISHAGARGLMQLMPGTANEQAGKMGLAYMSANLTQDTQYNIRLGDAYFARMLSYYGGSYPLAVAAYNAGAGNVNKWLRANGDPRTGSVDWLRWIEEIPFFETKNYVQRVLENAVVYEALHPERTGYGNARGITQFIGKRSPG
ncbi:lytic transglycosylase domain-containing protein [Parafrankia sp. BMG5.11]|uniref:lytic transglycosylase domain-containing protein n=1 Tax=Parafrankia sp. BMG5.11 TaxID=222540 RepID=UPI0010394D5B|nr:lytic transglycosylase domain-containing protein [Parafrankia sp. BMG5.11]TCJ37118.1 lytic transglycosylase domain-containing protein [Parafrankia sp. BMG5.11]